MQEKDKQNGTAEAQQTSYTERWNQGGKQIFSQEALDKMRSPEKLDTVLSITTPMGWIGLISVAVMLLAVVIWSIFGSFTVKANGMGLIMDSAGVAKISAMANGTMDEIYVHPGERVKKGALIAHVNLAQENAATRMAQYGPEMAGSSRDVISRVHEFDSKRYQKETAEYIYSPYDGIADEVLVENGGIVTSGTPVISVRLDNRENDLKGILYIPVDKGKRVEMGQSIQLAPGGVDISQTGSLIGVVRSVSQYPATLQSMKKNLGGNEQLAQMIIQGSQGAVMEVSFDLVKDPDSNSGYLWTSKVGEHKPVTAGSFCTGSIIIERRPPIEKVFYKLSQWLRSR
ncbi:HlyD family efflux transporter periplasmic adaptor subunit [Selenomonas sp. AE3005]|uniref:HlyD family efflux transporter periplasmic adaptor subunit n=1 Tax=Selenomonas sp. AE3005 TaxID=1485543 RepID=UPI0025D07625|nr:HlyD family efflux transporter periplasmic adaptor subunit [Selenomonas sp. AE3005]